jgi:hypothetical protein
VAAVNPSDVKAATGLMAYAVFPRTPGRDYAGIVIDGPRQWTPLDHGCERSRIVSLREQTHAARLDGNRRIINFFGGWYHGCSRFPGGFLGGFRTRFDARRPR